VKSSAAYSESLLFACELGLILYGPLERALARLPNWRTAAFAVAAGMFLGAALVRQNREMDDASPPVLADGQGTATDAYEEAASAGALEPLSADLLKARTIEIFPVGYLTLMAIIQGAAFGILFIQQGQLFKQGWSPHAALTLTQSLATGLSIVIVTHEYILLTVMVRWAPTSSDTLIPYLLGFGEIWMAMAAGQGTSWWTALSSLCAVAAFAFWHTRTGTLQDAFAGKRFIYERDRKYLATQTVLCIVMMLISVAMALLNSRDASPAVLNIGLTLGVILIGIWVLLKGARNQNQLYDSYHVPRWHSHADRRRIRNSLR
jgi:hypothetical protein